MSKRSFYLPAIILLFAASFYIARKIKNHSAPQINLSGIVLKDLDGNAVNMDSFAGKPLVVNFWGTWCAPCRQEFPGFEKVKATYGNQVNFLMVSDEPTDKLLKFKAESDYTFLYLQSQTPFKELGFTSVPFTYFYDANGKLVEKKRDPLSEGEINEFINKIIRRQ